MPNQASKTQAPASSRKKTPSTTAPANRTFVLDTSVLLADPAALRRFHSTRSCSRSW